MPDQPGLRAGPFTVQSYSVIGNLFVTIRIPFYVLENI